MDATLLLPILGLGSLGLLFGMFLAYAAKKFSVEVNPKVALILENLPGANCGGCGYPGCNGYAEALASGKAEISLCAPGGAATVTKIAEILGVENNASAIPKIAAVQCKGGHSEAKSKFVYQGVTDCTAAQMIDGGSKACGYGCLGLGSCVKACPFDAMSMGPNGLPMVDEKKCTGCGKCVLACPRQIITLIPINQKIYLGCVSHDKGKSVKDNCTVGCTGCSLCSRPKVTPSGAIVMDDNLPIIKEIYAEDLAVAAEKCPASCFVIRTVAE